MGKVGRSGRPTTAVRVCVFFFGLMGISWGDVTLLLLLC